MWDLCDLLTDVCLGMGFGHICSIRYASLITFLSFVFIFLILSLFLSVFFRNNNYDFLQLSLFLLFKILQCLHLLFSQGGLYDFTSTHRRSERKEKESDCFERLESHKFVEIF